MAAMQIDFDNAEKQLKNELVNANNAISTLETELDIVEKNAAKERAHLDDH